MTLAIIFTVFWVVMLIHDTKEFIYMKKAWGKESGHLTFIVVDTLCIVFLAWSIYMMCV